LSETKYGKQAIISSVFLFASCGLLTLNGVAMVKLNDQFFLVSRYMKKILLFSIAFLSSCSSQLAVRDCENLGYTKGTPEFTSCAERQLAERRKAISEMRKQETAVKIEREKASHGLFGRNSICNTTSNSDGYYHQECK
jgi:hypothetical protein